MRYFDYEKVGREAKLTQREIAELCKLIRSEFPKDDMMYELHLLRACMTIRDGHAKLEEVLQNGWNEN